MWRKTIWLGLVWCVLLPAAVLTFVLAGIGIASGRCEETIEDWIERAILRGHQWAYPEEYDKEKEA